MRVVETTGIFDGQGYLVVKMPDDIPHGKHQMVIVIDVPNQNDPQPQNEEDSKVQTSPPSSFKPLNATLAKPDDSL